MDSSRLVLIFLITIMLLSGFNCRPKSAFPGSEVKLAGVCGPYGNSLVILDATGKQIMQLLQLHNTIFDSPRLDPQGGQIAVTVHRHQTDQSEIIIVDSQTGEMSPVFKAKPRHIAYGSSWSLDGEKLAFTVISLDHPPFSESTASDVSLVVTDRLGARVSSTAGVMPIQWIGANRLIALDVQRDSPLYVELTVDADLQIHRATPIAWTTPSAGLLALSPDGGLAASGKTSDKGLSHETVVTVTNVKTKAQVCEARLDGSNLLGLFWVSPHLAVVSVETSQSLGVATSQSVYLLDAMSGKARIVTKSCAVGGGSMSSLFSFYLLVKMDIEASSSMKQ